MPRPTLPMSPTPQLAASLPSARVQGMSYALPPLTARRSFSSPVPAPSTAVSLPTSLTCAKTIPAHPSPSISPQPTEKASASPSFYAPSTPRRTLSNIRSLDASLSPAPASQSMQALPSGTLLPTYRTAAQSQSQATVPPSAPIFMLQIWQCGSGPSFFAAPRSSLST